MDLAIVQFKKAIEIDPEYALAYGRLSGAYALKNINYGLSLLYIDSAELYAKKGLEIDKNCDWCYKGLSQVEAVNSNLVIAIEYGEKALEINPNNVNVAFNMVNEYYNLGMIEKALELLPRMLRNGNLTDQGMNMAILHYNVGDYKKVKSYLDIVVNSVPGGINQITQSSFTWRYARFHYKLGDVDGFIAGIERHFKNTADSVNIYYKCIVSYWIQKDYQSVIKYYEENQQEINRYQNDRAFYFYLLLIPHSYLLIGDLDNAIILGKEYLEILETRRIKSDKGFAHLMSMGYLFTNETDNSLDWLDKAIDIGYLGDISTDILYEPIYDHPRFQELVEKQKKKREEILVLVATYNFPEPEDL